MVEIEHGGNVTLQNFNMEEIEHGGN